jgi:hypothetical protein
VCRYTSGFHVTFDPDRAPDAAHPEKGLVFNERWFAALDRVLVTARAAGVRVMLPVVGGLYKWNPVGPTACLKATGFNPCT